VSYDLIKNHLNHLKINEGKNEINKKYHKDEEKRKRIAFNNRKKERPAFMPVSLFWLDSEQIKSLLEDFILKTKVVVKS
jgi:hypothetical protein